MKTLNLYIEILCKIYVFVNITNTCIVLFSDKPLFLTHQLGVACIKTCGLWNKICSEWNCANITVNCAKDPLRFESVYKTLSIYTAQIFLPL